VAGAMVDQGLKLMLHFSQVWLSTFKIVTGFGGRATIVVFGHQKFLLM
jgi:hypothetical protein